MRRHNKQRWKLDLFLISCFVFAAFSLPSIHLMPCFCHVVSEQAGRQKKSSENISSIYIVHFLIKLFTTFTHEDNFIFIKEFFIEIFFVNGRFLMNFSQFKLHLIINLFMNKIIKYLFLKVFNKFLTTQFRKSFLNKPMGIKRKKERERERIFRKFEKDLEKISLR